MFVEKLFGAQAAEIRQRGMKPRVWPVPPSERLHARGDVVGKSLPHDARRVSHGHGIIRYSLRHDGAGANHRAIADAPARQNDGAVADPDIMADHDAVRAPPGEEFVFVLLTVEIGAGAIAEMRLAR